jgi:hypothetical protein
MNRRVGGGALLAVAAFMLIGFLRSGAGLGSPTALVALLLTVALPAYFGVSLIRGALGGPPKARLQALRQQTIDAEILRLAMQNKGRLTSMEVASALALPEAEAKASLEGLVMRESADMEITDDGVLVYSFRDARLLGGKDSAKDLLNG